MLTTEKFKTNLDKRLTLKFIVKVSYINKKTRMCPCFKVFPCFENHALESDYKNCSIVYLHFHLNINYFKQAMIYQVI